MEETTDNDKERSKELTEIYNIFKEIYAKAPTVLKNLSCQSIDIDYKEFVHDRIDFKTINQNIQDEEYTSMTDVIKDIRLVFLNCYSFYGAKSDHTIKSLQLEELLENKINCLDEHFKTLASIELTFSLLKMELKPNSKLRYPKNCYDSLLLRCVAHRRPERLKEYHQIFSNTLTTNDDNAHILEKIVSWKHEIYFNDNYHYISSMWELPEIGNFLAIIFKEFDFDIVNQGEIERMFLMPKESTTMGKIMTTLLKPIKKKAKYIDQVMPYKIWSEKLLKKVSEWYKVYYIKKRNKVSVMKSLGIHPDFWAVLGDKNPLVECDYCELSYFMKVWILKGLCDYIINKYKTINNIITNCKERQCTIWKNDMATEEYFTFNSMPDLRIYYYNIPYDEPNIEFLESEKIDEDKEKDTSFFSDISNIFHSKSRVKPNEKYFKMIANSVQGLRSFLNELDTEDTSVPENLIEALENFIMKMEPEECNQIILNNDSKIKLFKDWKTYPERHKNEQEEILFWEEKEVKPYTPGINNEIILEKRNRKVTIKEGFDFDLKFDTDDCDEKSDCAVMSDLSDSEDEWGALNQPKNKSKHVVQTPSKLVEIEKRLKNEGKLSNHFVKNIINCDIKDTFGEIEKENKSIVYEQENGSISSINEDDKVINSIVQTTNTLHNGYNEGSVCLKNKNIENMEIEVSSDEEIVSINSENEEIILIDSENEEVILIDSEKNGEEKLFHCEKQICVLEDDESINVQPNATKNKIETLEDQRIVIIDDDKLENFDMSREDNLETTNSSVQQILISNENDNDNIKDKSVVSNSDGSNEVITIQDDDEQIVISDDEDDIQILYDTPKPQDLPVRINRSYSLNTHLNKSRNSVIRTTKMRTTNCTNRQEACTSLPKLSSNISIMPANVNLPKDIEVSVVHQPQTKIPSYYNATKRSTVRSNGNLTNNGSVVNVECKVISKQNLNGEVKFYVSLPNGKLHPVSDELMNQYLKEHNNRLPNYWMVPLSIEVARQYGFN